MIYPNAQQQAPAVTQTTASPVPVVSATTWADILKIIGPFAVVLAIFAVRVLENRKVLTPDQSGELIPLIKGLLVATEATTSAVRTTKAAADEPVVPTPPPPPSGEVTVRLTPEQLDVIQKLILEFLERLSPKPRPEPDPDPKPNPEPPPASLKISVTDESGKPLAGQTVDAGALFLVTTTSTKVGWQVSTHGKVRAVTLPSNLGYSFTLERDSWIEFFLTDYDSRSQVGSRVTANHSPQPPPDPQPEPKPDPDPKPDPKPSDRVLGLILFTDKASIDPDTAKVTNSVYWNQLAETHRVATFLRSTNDVAGKAFVKEVTIPTGNVLLIREEGKEKLACIPMPKTVEALKAEIAKWSSK